MAAPSLTYTLSNGATADASQVMQNFNDLLNGVTDGTKDLSISAVTCAGTATLNGNINLGNASGDDLTITASLASNLVPKTDATYGLGSSSIGLSGAYFGGNSHRVRIVASGSTSADWTMTLPTGAGSNGDLLQTNGSGVSSWVSTITGAKTFSSSPVLAAGLTFSANCNVLANTSDGSDNLYLILAGGGGTSASRGGNLQVFGNDVATFGGRIYYASGDAAGASTTNPAHVWQNGAGTTIGQTTGNGVWMFKAGAQVKDSGAGSDVFGHYEEGTFTPTVKSTGTAGTVTYAAQVGAFTRIGRCVYWQCHVQWTNWTGSPTLNLKLDISGIGYAAKNTSGLYNTVAVQSSNVVLPAGAVTVIGEHDPNTQDVFVIINKDSAASTTVLASSNAGAATRDLFMAGFYFV